MPKLPADAVSALDRRDAQEARERARKGQRPYHADAPVCRLSGPMTAEACRAGLCHKSFFHPSSNSSVDRC
eukprot:11376926-Alexandrium_andersonii.AAC.1